MQVHTDAIGYGGVKDFVSTCWVKNQVSPLKSLKEKQLQEATALRCKW